MSRDPELRTHKRSIEDRRVGPVPRRVCTHPRRQARRDRAGERDGWTAEQRAASWRRRFEAGYVMEEVVS